MGFQSPSPRFLSVVLLLLAASGCSGLKTQTANVYKSHTLMYSGEGQPLHIDSRPVQGEPREKQDDEESPCQISETVPAPAGPHQDNGVHAVVNSWRGLLPGRFFQPEHCEEYEQHLDRVFQGLIASGKKQVMIYLHGGLNDIGPTLQREEGLIACDAVRERTGEKKECIEDDFYPIFINWSSSLRSNYRDHLFRVRQGQLKPGIAKLTSPFVLAENLISAYASLPTAGTEELLDAATARRDRDWQAALERYEAGQIPLDIYVGADRRSGGRKVADAMSWFPIGVSKIITTPLVQGLGQPAWEILNRRTSILLDKERQPRYPGTPGVLQGATGDGPLSPFFRKLLDVQRQHPDLELTLIGHSMGAIILNNALRHFPKLEARNIVYMAAACSLDDYQDTIFPYLMAHPRTEMYHLTLQERAELLERHWPWREVTPRGSLLVWIDNFLEDPRYRLDRTAGRIFNLLREVDRTPAEIRDRVHIKSFDFGPAVEACHPQVHGGFDNVPFWKPEYWQPATGKLGCTPGSHRGADAPANAEPPEE